MPIDGRALAKKIIERLKAEPAPKKIFAAVLVGNDPASLNFLRQKEKTAKELGVDYRLYNFQADLKNDELRRRVGELALSKSVGGAIVQLPLPEHINKHYILNIIPKEKDVDVLGERALGAFYTDRNPVLPPAAGTVEEILRTHDFKLNEKTVAVVGLGLLVGKPIANWLSRKARTLYLLRQGSNFGVLREADLVISGTGSPGLIKPSELKPGAGVIDFGYFWGGEGKISGDLDMSDQALDKLGFYTPTPGGTGPVLVAKLFENFYELNSE